MEKQKSKPITESSNTLGSILFKNESPSSFPLSCHEYELDKISFMPHGVRDFIHAMIADHKEQLNTVKPSDFRRPSNCALYKEDLKQEVQNLETLLKIDVDNPFLIVEFKEANSRNSFVTSLGGQTRLSLFYMRDCKLSFSKGKLVNEITHSDALKNVFIINGQKIKPHINFSNDQIVSKR